MVYKYCPKCDEKVPIATKSCICNHIFFGAGKKLITLKPEKEGKSLKLKGKSNKSRGPTLIRRRTERLSRGKPAFYSASEFENYPVKFRKLSSNSPDKGGKRKHRGSPKKKLGRPKGALAKAKKKEVPEENKEEDLYANMTPERSFVYSITLAEINRKLQSDWIGTLLHESKPPLINTTESEIAPETQTIPGTST